MPSPSICVYCGREAHSFGAFQLSIAVVSRSRDKTGWPDAGGATYFAACSKGLG